MDEQPAAKKAPHLMDEADVGSGEKSPGQQDTQALIDQIGERPAAPAEHKAGPASADAEPDPDTAVAPPGVAPRPANSASAGPP